MIFSIIFTLIVCMGIGYSYIQSQVFLGGNATVSKQIWKIEQKNLTMDLDSSATESSIKFVNTNKKIEAHFTASLSSIDDYYSFYFDIENNGTLDAKIDSFTLQGLSEIEKNNLDYIVTYLNGEEININDPLNINVKKTIKIYVKHKISSPISSGNYNLSFKINFITKSGTVNDDTGISLLNIISSSASLDNSIDFTKNSPIDDTTPNGSGLRILKGTETDTYPIYFYRGNVDNNNLIFSNLCWKIIKTTNTGGIKIIYNGTSNSNTCEIETGSSTVINGNFNDAIDRKASINKIGYMYNDKYETTTWVYESESKYKFGESYIYDESTQRYTLVNTIDEVQTSDISTHHYTCLSTEDTCEQMKYIFYITGTTYYYVELSNGEDEKIILNNIRINANNSSAKNTLEAWFDKNLSTKINYLEDTVFCNDRSILVLGGWQNTGNVGTWINFGNKMNNSNYNLTCPNNEDAFTVLPKNGNGKNFYPIGLITANEIIMAGSYSGENSNFYLYNKVNSFTMTPLRFTNGFADLYYIGNNGALLGEKSSSNFSLRPVISLNKDVRISSGTGTKTNPYIVK